jgi:hypothetical protein
MDPTDTEAVVPSRKWGICLLVGGFAVQLVPFLLSRRIFARRKLRRLQAVEERVFATFSCFVSKILQNFDKSGLTEIRMGQRKGFGELVL